MSFLDRLRVKTADGPTGVPVDLGDDSPTHYLTDDPEADSPSDPWRYGFTRRRFIQAGATSALGCAALANQLTTSRYSFSPFGARPAAAQTGLKTLVCLTFRGGIDGLRVCGPVDDPLLMDKRPELALRGGEALPLGGGFGLNPRMQPLKQLYDAGTLAIVHGCGNTDHHDRSHFSATARNESANGVGYLDGFMQTQAERTALSSVAVDGKLPGLFNGPVGELALGGGIEDFRLRGPDEDVLAQVISTMYEGQGDLASQQVASTMSALETAQMLADAGYQPANGAAYPGGGLGRSLRETAQLIKADVGVEAVFAEANGWDTHTNEAPQLNGLLGQLASSLAAFAQDLGSLMSDVAVLTMSEFGRTVRENGNRGTDHGHGTAMMVIGGEVAGGRVYGDWPGLGEETLYQGRDLAVTTDFRDLFAEVLRGHLGSRNLDGVFPGYRPNAKSLGLFG